MPGLNPYNLNKLLGGATRVLYAPMTVALPASISDVFGQVSPYNPLTGWLDFGAAREGTSYGREFESEGYEIQQQTGDVIEEITGVERQIDLSIAEFSTEHLKMLEEAPSIATLTAAANKSQMKKVAFGTVIGLTRFRMAVVARRATGIGSDVVEPGGATRGSFVGWVGYSVGLAPESSEIEFEKGNLSHIPLSFKSYPVSGQAQGQENGYWIEEQPGTIAAI